MQYLLFLKLLIFYLQLFHLNYHFQRRYKNLTIKAQPNECYIYATKLQKSVLHFSIRLTACSIQSIRYLFDVVIFLSLRHGRRSIDRFYSSRGSER